MTDSPSLLLQRAAEHLEALSVRVSVPPWWVGLHGDSVEADPETVAHDVLCDADAAWIAALSPAVAAPLVAWLRAIAANMDQAGIREDWARAVYPPEARASLDFARLVLGVSTEDKE